MTTNFRENSKPFNTNDDVAYADRACYRIM